jgi:hypothetical protein
MNRRMRNRTYGGMRGVGTHPYSIQRPPLPAICSIAQDWRNLFEIPRDLRIEGPRTTATSVTSSTEWDSGGLHGHLALRGIGLRAQEGRTFS